MRFVLYNYCWLTYWYLRVTYFLLKKLQQLSLYFSSSVTRQQWVRSRIGPAKVFNMWESSLVLVFPQSWSKNSVKGRYYINSLFYPQAQTLFWSTLKNMINSSTNFGGLSVFHFCHLGGGRRWLRTVIVWGVGRGV